MATTIPRRVIDLTGCVFGDLEVLQFEELVEGRGARWRCRCSGCGRELLRFGSQLRASVARGDVSACGDCHNEHRRGRAAEHDRLRGEFWAFYYQQYGDVWPAASTERMVHDIAEELEVAGFSLDPVDFVIRDPLAPVPTPSSPVRRGGQRAAFLYPISSRRKVWRCAQCKRDNRSRGYGCTACIEFICRICFRNERHHCPIAASWATCEWATLEAIARDLECSRERVRQIETKALRKLRHPSRSKRLRHFIEQDEDSPSSRAVPHGPVHLEPETLDAAIVRAWLQKGERDRDREARERAAQVPEPQRPAAPAQPVADRRNRVLGRVVRDPALIDAAIARARGLPPPPPAPPPVTTKPVQAREAAPQPPPVPRVKRRVVDPKQALVSYVLDTLTARSDQIGRDNAVLRKVVTDAVSAFIRHNYLPALPFEVKGEVVGRHQYSLVIQLVGTRTYLDFAEFEEMLLNLRSENAEEAYG